DLLAIGTQSETVWSRAELISVKCQVTAGRNQRAVWNPVFDRIMAVVGEQPAADVDRVGRGVEQLDAILLGRVCVREGFVDEDGRDSRRCRIGLTGRTADGAAGPPTLFQAPGVQRRGRVANHKR